MKHVMASGLSHGPKGALQLFEEMKSLGEIFIEKFVHTQ
jgi:hypothetical protein